jgi:hypothetical protein
MEPAAVIRRILESARGEGICDACLAFAVEMPLATVQGINTDFSLTSGDYVRNVGPCHNCGRVTARTAFVGVPNEIVADRRRKCVRCSRRVTKDDEHTNNGGLFHRQCWAILQSQAEIANSRQMVRLSRTIISRSRERLDGSKGDGAPSSP